MKVFLLCAMLAGCASTRATGECKNYKPLALCSAGFEVKCEMTRDGCEQCGCMPIVDDGGRAPYDIR